MSANTQQTNPEHPAQPTAENTESSAVESAATPEQHSPSILKQKYQQAAANLKRQSAGTDSQDTTTIDEVINTEAPDPQQEEPDVTAVMEQVLAERDQFKDHLLRTRAEMDNLRKRTEKEKVNSAQFAITNFAKDLLTVADAFTEAQKALPDDDTEQAPEKNGLVTGFKMTHKELLRVFNKHGLAQIPALGEEFDPDKHQAITQLPVDGDNEAGTVAQVMQEGFTLNGRLLRPALVAVYQ